MSDLKLFIATPELFYVGMQLATDVPRSGWQAWKARHRWSWWLRWYVWLWPVKYRSVPLGEVVAVDGRALTIRTMGDRHAAGNPSRS